MRRRASRGLERAVIESECEAYISDRADALGLADTGADVTARWSEEGFLVSLGVRARLRI